MQIFWGRVIKGVFNKEKANLSAKLFADKFPELCAVWKCDELALAINNVSNYIFSHLEPLNKGIIAFLILATICCHGSTSAQLCMHTCWQDTCFECWRRAVKNIRKIDDVFRLAVDIENKEKYNVIYTLCIRIYVCVCVLSFWIIYVLNCLCYLTKDIFQTIMAKYVTKELFLSDSFLGTPKRNWHPEFEKLLKVWCSMKVLRTLKKYFWAIKF